MLIYHRLMYLLAYFLRVEVIIINEKKFDTEYPCQWAKEQQWLSEHGVRYTFVKTIDGITTWKYKKNLQLFKSLCLFYENVYSKE